MRRLSRLFWVLGSAIALGAVASPVHAQTPPVVTITFTLTLAGAPSPPQDSFSVEWPESGVVLCFAPCIPAHTRGGGRTYQQSTTFPQGSDRHTFVFVRSSGSGARQEFGRQTVSAQVSHTIRAVFTYRTAATTVGTPSTGAAPSIVSGITLACAGAGLVFVGLRFRRRGAN